jgi:predicted RNA binding protein YcfA (HicA-like mRNA interferase family)
MDMNGWPASRAGRVLRALYRNGWTLKRQTDSHRTPGLRRGRLCRGRPFDRLRRPDYVFAFHDDAEIGPRMLARIARRTGLRPEDL